MTDYPKVSVVTITYGHEKYITQTLDGVLMQDYPGEIEFIIANDNSPDDTDDVIRKHLSKNKIPRNFTIKYTKHEQNKGAIYNFAWALEQASGKYIAMCEGDDYWTDCLKLQKQIDFLEKNKDYSLCFTGKSNIDNKGSFVSEVRYEQKTWSVDDVLDGSFIAGLQTIVSKNLSHEFIEFCNQFPNRTGGDRLYTYFYAIKGKLKYIDDNTAVYRIHIGGIWSTLSEKQKLIAHIKQHLLFLEVVKKDDSHFKQLKRNMFRLVLSDLYFKFYNEPAKTAKHLFYVLKDYKISPVVFLLAGIDYLSYYTRIVASKFKFGK